MKFNESNRLRERAKRLIPGGAHTYSKGDDQFPYLSPGFITHALGARVWDPDGNEFIDWGMGLRSVCLGHAYEPILDEVRAQLERGVNFTRPSLLEADLAEFLVDLVPAAEMVKFAKNGSDVTTAAVRLARAFTDRDVVIRCIDHPFFSVDDWFIGNTAMDAGIPKSTKELTKNFPFNDVNALEQLLNSHRGQVACIILEPAATAAPAPGFLERVKELSIQHGAVLIFDEIITGFRWNVRGAQHLYGVTPDLATFGKAMANGFSLSALVGKREIMERGGLEHHHPRVFLLSTTNGTECHCLAASLRTIQILRDTPIIEENWHIGRQLREGFNELAASHGIGERAKMQGVDISPWYAFYDAEGNPDLGLRTLFLQETIRNGVLMPYIAISASHRQLEVAHTLEAVDKAMKIVAKAVDQGGVQGLLHGSVVKPVFRKFN
jgi:glutamate-1-semialdehyde 2,1-aminomutase